MTPEEAGDVPLQAIRALIAAAPYPMAALDAAGGCVFANAAYVQRPAGGASAQRSPFSPDGVRQWTLVTILPAALPATTGQTGFLTAISHELRTPLNAVIGFAEMIRDQALGPIDTPEYIDYAGHILQSGQHLLTLINDILDFTRIENGSLRLQSKAVEMNALLDDTLDQLAPAAAHGGVMLAREMPHERITIRADAPRLRQALLKLAGNAVKFTPPGGHIAVRLQAAAEGGAVITIADSGIGIDARSLPHVFEPFWQADSGLDRLKAGTGMGLPLARRLVTLHGGRLDVTSGPGQGTKVVMQLPAGRETEPAL